MIIPFYGTCKSTIIWVIEISLRVNSIGEKQHLSENVSVSAARLELVLLITKDTLGERREIRDKIPRNSRRKKISERKLKKFLWFYFFFFPPRC